MVTEARKSVRKVSLAGERRVKQDMPVDTGRARASWGHWSGADVNNNPKASPADAEWEEKNQGMTITQGTNVEYVEGLNAGNSQQAPAGFIDAAEADMQRKLDAEIDAIMRRFTS